MSRTDSIVSFPTNSRKKKRALTIHRFKNILEEKWKRNLGSDKNMWNLLSYQAQQHLGDIEAKNFRMCLRNNERKERVCVCWVIEKEASLYFLLVKFFLTAKSIQSYPQKRRERTRTRNSWLFVPSLSYDGSLKLKNQAIRHK